MSAVEPIPMEADTGEYAQALMAEREAEERAAWARVERFVRGTLAIHGARPDLCAGVENDLALVRGALGYKETLNG